MLVIIGFAAVAVAPRVTGGLKQRQVRQSVRAFVSAVRRSSAAAITERKRAAFTVWPDEGEFTYPGAKEPYRLPEFAEFGDVDGGRLGDDDDVLYEFYPTGSSSGGSVELVFDLGGRRRQVYRMIINPLLSTVSIEDDS